MIQRLCFALKNGWVNRTALKVFLTDPQYRIQTLRELTSEKLEQANIAILVIDFDGVLANHGATFPLPEAEQWLRKLSQDIGEQRIAILTNRPLPERLKYFAQFFPSIFVVQGVKKKPYPDGIWQIANYKGVAPHRVALLDDRLLTGMLATCLSYSRGYYFCKPYTNFWRHPLKESFFSVLRAFERWVFMLVK
jgi:uncharacterized protein